MISIVIPTYNHCDDLLKPCLESIRQHTDLSQVEVIVVANGCTDNTRDYVESLGHPFKLIWMDEAAGYTKATNEGIKSAKGDFICLLNNDTVLLGQPKNQWIDLLLDPFFNDKDMGLTGPMINHDPHSGKNFLVFFCVMIRRKVIQTIGILDEIFSPGFGEDTDYCIRAINAGFKISQVPPTKLRESDPSANKMGGPGMLMIGDFPIYHAGEMTFREDDPKFQGLIHRNSRILQEKWGDVYPDGFFSEQDINVYRSFVGRHGKGAKMAEVGTWKGRSLCSVHNVLKDNDMSVWAVDTFTGTSSSEFEIQAHAAARTSDIEAIFRENLDRFGLTDRVTVIKEKSVLAASLFPNKFFDIVFIDADHSYETALADIRAWWPKVKNGGILSGHDYMWGGVRKALETEFREDSIHTDWNNMWYVDKPMVYDCFMFSNELDILEIRLNELDKVVDKFVLVESPTTIMGKPKPLYYELNKERYAKFKDKIIHIVVNDMPDGVDQWPRERLQRDAIMRGLTNCKDDDIIIIADVDEIPSAKAVKKYNKGMGIVSFEQMFCYYYLNCVADHKWDWAKITTYDKLKGLMPGGVRYAQNTPKIEDGGWHFSFVGGVDKIIEKIESYSHQEYNKPEIKDKDRIAKKIAAGEDIFNRGTKYQIKKIDSSWPDVSAYSHLIHPVDAHAEVVEVTAVISTKDRYASLANCLVAVASQTYRPKEVIIYDDGEQRDLREDQIFHNIFSMLNAKDIAWRVLFGEKRGQVHNHQRSLKDAETEWIWRLDDDNVPESDVLSKLVAKIGDNVGAVGGLVLDPKAPLASSGTASNKIEDIYLGLNIQWFRNSGVKEVDHLYSTFLFRKEAAEHGYCTELSPVGHREETIFTYEMKRKGWDLIVTTDAITWHLRSGKGGIRSYDQKFFWEHDEEIFSKRLARWGVKPSRYKMVVLDSGLGDHLVFKTLIPELKAKYDKLIVANCYPKIFKDEGITMISIAEAKTILDVDEHNVYKFMHDRNWTGSLVDAYREQLGLK